MASNNLDDNLDDYEIYLYIGEGNFSYSLADINRIKEKEIKEGLYQNKNYIFILTEYREKCEEDQIIQKEIKSLEDENLKIFFEFEFDAKNGLCEQYYQILNENCFLLIPNQIKCRAVRKLL